MDIYYMKQDALDLLKANMDTLYKNYFTQYSIDWFYNFCKENDIEEPFEKFRTVEDFSLAELNADRLLGAIDAENCKIVYEMLKGISPVQASDERLWTGMCHKNFYEYIRKRFGYAASSMKKKDTDISTIMSRFMFQGTGRNGYLRNVIGKCWWVGKALYTPENPDDTFHKLTILGCNDFNSKVTELFYNYKSNNSENVLSGIIDGIDRVNQNGGSIIVREELRPTLQYINALGGSEVLDCMSEEEISNIFFNQVMKIRHGELKAEEFISDVVEEEDEENNEEATIEKIADFGSKLKCANIESGEEKMFTVLESALPTHVWIGHKIGDTLILGGQEYEIMDISNN